MAGSLLETRTTRPGEAPRVNRKLVDPSGPLSQVVAEFDGSGSLGSIVDLYSAKTLAPEDFDTPGAPRTVTYSRVLFIDYQSKRFLKRR